MPNPVCISPLKFYDSLAKQSHRKSYAYGHISPLITKAGWIPPFQFVIPNQLYADGGDIAEAILYNAKTEESFVDLLNITKDSVEYCGHYYPNYVGSKTELASYNWYQFIAENDMEIWWVSQPAYSDIILAIYNNGEAESTNFVSPRYRNDITSPGGTNTLPTENNKLYVSKGQLVVISCDNNGRNFLFRKSPKLVNTIDGYKVFISKGFFAKNTITEGLYYLKLASGNSGVWTYYSEVFCFDNITKDCLELEYWNETGNFAVKNGVIAFPADFHFKLLLKGEIGKPEYNFEEESTKRLGYIFVESQVSKKTYKFNTVVPEYICDALRLVRLCDNKIIRCKDDEYEAITFEMEAEWQTQGDLASVTCEFETDNVVANIGGFVPDKLGGDYNNDYNEDFDKE